MSIQSSDRFIYNGRCYTLIDVEKDKQIIDCAEFIMPEQEYRRGIDFGCRRGYTADYSIEQGKLYGIRCERDWSKRENIKSSKMFMNFTGSCVIAIEFDERAKWYISDFLECYLDFDEALELHFTDGVLDEVRDLKDAIAEMRLLENEEIYKLESTEPITRQRMREEIAIKHLKYKYGFRSYKWRGSGPDEPEVELERKKDKRTN